MPVLNVASEDPGAIHETDICIIGSGPAGGTLATALGQMSCRVTLVESGGIDPDPALQSLNEIAYSGYPGRQDFMTRVRLFGGASNLWPGRCMRLRPLDIARRDWVANSGWPISYDELARYYPAAAQRLGLPSLPNRPDATDIYAYGGDEAGLAEAGELRPDCALWGKSPRRIGKADRRRFERRGDRTLLLSLTALELRMNEAQTRVTTIRAVSPGGRRVELRAHVFVLACGGLENARLLLASHKQYASGVGNTHDQVGRYYMDHPRAIAGRVRLTGRPNLGRLLGVPLADGRLKMGLTLSPDRLETEGLLSCLVDLEPSYSPGSTLIYGSAMEAARRLYRRRFGHHAGQRVPLAVAGRYLYQLTLRELMPHWLYHQLHFIRKRRATELVAVAHCEQAPDPASRVTLTADRDRFGMPKPCLHWQVGEPEQRSAQRTLQVLDSVLRRQRLGELTESDATPEFGDAAHPMGTTRMSSDPRAGAVDSDCRIHGMDNLYMAGSSVFATGGYANPTLTIVALALRLADHLRRKPDFGG